MAPDRMLIAIPLNYFSPKITAVEELSELKRQHAIFSLFVHEKWKTKEEKNEQTHEIEREKSEIIHMKITIYMHVKSCTRFHDGARYPSTTVVHGARTKSAVVPSLRRTSTHYADGELYTNSCMVVASPYLL